MQPVKFLKKSIFFILCLFVISTPRVCSAGLPVIDYANLMQNIIQYAQLLEEYEELLAQTGLLDDQYQQMLEDYKQVLIEYAHYLHQIESLAEYISQEDWDRLMEVIDSYYGSSEMSTIPPMDSDSETYDQDVDNVFGNYDYVPRDPVEVQADAQPMGLWTEQYEREVTEDYNNYDLLKDKMRMVSENVKRSKARKDLIRNHAETVQNLGDESDLATLQEIATQNVLLMNQNEDLVQILNQQLMNQEMHKAERARAKARARDAEIERLQNRKPTALLGRDRWGDW